MKGCGSPGFITNCTPVRRGKYSINRAPEKYEHRRRRRKGTLTATKKIVFLCSFYLGVYLIESTKRMSDLDGGVTSTRMFCRFIASASILPARNPYLQRWESRLYASVTKVMMNPIYTKYLLKRHLLNRLRRRKVVRQKRRKRQELEDFELSEVSRTPVVILSAHRKRFRVLYVIKKKIVAGKLYGQVIAERYRAPIHFNLIRWKNDTYSLQLQQQVNEINRYVIADNRHDDLRVCQASSAQNCVSKDSRNATVATPIFRLLHSAPLTGPVFTYRLMMVFEVAGRTKYVQIMGDTGQSVLKPSPARATKFMMILGINFP